MEFGWTKEDEAFKEEVRGFIKEVLPADWTGLGGESSENLAFSRAVERKLGARRWLVLAWPKEYGGLGATHWQQLIFKEEGSYNRLPGMTNLGINVIGPSIMIYGNDEQKEKYLPGIASGELHFCQMFTEPGAGSDLGSLTTRATRDGDFYLINGQKTFTSGAHQADYGWLAARTDPDAPKHKGVSTFVIPTNLPGITITPQINVMGEHHQNHVFFDNVRLPREQLVGVENRGFYQVMTTLDFERSGVERWAGGRRLLDDLVSYVISERGSKGVAALPSGVRNKLADAAITAEAGRYICYRITHMQSQGMIPNKEASMSKVLNAHFYQGIANLGVNVLGMYGPLHHDSKWAKLRGLFEYQILSTIPTTISGGSVEINRNIIANRGLELPRQ